MRAALWPRMSLLEPKCPDSGFPSGPFGQAESDGDPSGGTRESHPVLHTWEPGITYPWGMQTERWHHVPRHPLLGAPGTISHRLHCSGAQEGT